MEKTKKNLLLRSAGVLMGVSILSTCVLGGTLAKYITSGKGTASATVAKFDVELNDGKLNSSDSTSLNLFNDILDTDSSPEKDVTEHKIAPGTRGLLPLKVTNKSDVTIQYTVSIEDHAGVDSTLLNRFKFSLDGDDWKTIDEIKASPLVSGKSVAIGATDNDTSLLWKWDFENGDNTDDTNLGMNAVTDPVAIVDVNVEAVQVD